MEKDRPDHEIVDGVEVYNFRGIRRPEIARPYSGPMEPGDIVIFHAHDCQVASDIRKDKPASDKNTCATLLHREAEKLV